MVSKRVISIVFGFLLMISLVSASWDVEITKLNDKDINNPAYYPEKVTSIKYVLSGIDCTNATGFWYSLDGGLTNSSQSGVPCSPTEMRISGLNSNENWNTWVIYVNDTSGNMKSDSLDFWVDNITPVLDYSNPSEDISYTNGNMLTLQFWLNETNKGSYHPINFAPFSLNIYDPWGVLFDIPTLSNLSSGDGTLSEVYNKILVFPNLGEGNYTWIAKAKDVFPNGTVIREVSLSGTIIRDTLNPSLTITSPLSGSYNYPITQIDFTASDTNLDYCGFSNGSVTENVTNCASHPFTSQEGENNWTISVYDKAGNSNTSMVSFFVDSMAPEINLTYPLTGSYNYHLVELNYTVSDLHLESCWYSLDNGATNISTPCSGNIAGITSVEGSNTWIVYANDSFGLESSSQVIFSVDVTAPNITLNGGNPQYIEAGDDYIELGATATDNVDTSVTIVIDNSSVNTNVLGTYYVYYNANDSAGNSALTVNRTIIVQDTKAPLLTLDSPVSGLYNYQLTEINFTVSDFSLDSCWYSLDNGATNIPTPCSGNIAGITSVEGSNTWIVYANDSSGNENSSSITFVIDTTPPSITIHSPLDNLTYIVSSVSLEVSSDEPGNWSYSLDDGLNNLSFTPNTTIPSLANGDYNLTVYVEDLSGNENSSTVSFTVDVPSYGSSSGGGKSSCVNVWNCTSWGEWSACKDGSQERKCIEWEKVGCGKGISIDDVKNLIETQECISEPAQSSNEQELEVVPPVGPEAEQEDSEGFFSRITGGAVGFVRSGTGKATIITIAALSLLLGVVHFIRKRNVALLE